jgi:hypothetical protein
VSEIKDGGPAFPVSTREAGALGQTEYGHQDGYDTWQFGGLTIRDYMAAKAMRVVATRHVHQDSEVPFVSPISFDDLAADAYALADAMLRARG